MEMMFTTEEENLVGMYREKSRMDTIDALCYVLEYISDDTMIRLVYETIGKLQKMSDGEFDNRDFELTVEY